MSQSLAILGAGNMAEAIARGILKSKILSPSQITASDVSPERRALFQQLGIASNSDNREAVRNASIVLLSVKPQQMANVLTELASALRPDALIVSIAAGISTAFIARHLGASQPARRIIRAMPNTPMLVGEGMVALARGSAAADRDMIAARQLFESAASVIEVAEDQMDTVTALSGSGPAYFFFLVEHMIRAGVELGLSPEHARQLASKTALGAARMLVDSEDSPETLRRKVTSPGGTTHAAITHLESREVPRAIVDAIKAAHARGRELGQ